MLNSAASNSAVSPLYGLRTSSPNSYTSPSNQLGNISNAFLMAHFFRPGFVFLSDFGAPKIWVLWYAGNSSKQLGFVAEDVAKILPELAVTKSEGGKEVVRNVDYEKLTVLLVSEVQNLRKELNEIKGNSGNNW